MNGKCRRVKGFWSRGITRNNAFFTVNPSSSSVLGLFSIKFTASLKIN